MDDLGWEWVQAVENVGCVYGADASASAGFGDSVVDDKEEEAGENRGNGEKKAEEDGMGANNSQTIVAPLVSDSLTKKSIKSDRTNTSRSTVTSSRSNTSHSPMRPMQSWTRRRSPSEIWCMCLGKGRDERQRVPCPFCLLLFHMPKGEGEARYKRGRGRGTHQSRSTSSNANNLSRRSLCRYPPTESRKCETTMSDRTTGLDAHSVPR